jgi:hypothetical protein
MINEHVDRNRVDEQRILVDYDEQCAVRCAAKNNKQTDENMSFDKFDNENVDSFTFFHSSSINE